MDSLDLEELTPFDRQLIDSCLKIFHTAEYDTNKLYAINVIIEESWDDNVWPKYNSWVYKFIQNRIKNQPTNYERGILMQNLAVSIGNIGYVYDEKGDVLKALEYYLKSLKIQKEIDEKKGMATTLNNIGYVYLNQGDIPKSLEYFHKSLKIREEIRDKKGVAISLNNLGAIYQNQEDFSKALEYYHNCLKISEEIDDKKRVALSLNNIGRSYFNYGDINKALEYYHRSLKIQEAMADKYSMAISLNNIASVHLKRGETDAALKHFYECLTLREEIGDKEGIAIALTNIGSIELKNEGNSGLSIINDYFLRAFGLGKELGYPKIISRASLGLSKVYEKKQNHKKALNYYKLHIQMRDSINNKETQKAAIKQQTQYEFEKEQIRKENEAKEQARILAQELKRRNNMEYSLIFLGILALFGIVMMLGFIKVSPNIAEGLIFFTFLIFFEFLLVFTEPYLEQYTQGEPVYALLANSALALIIFPLHAVLEKLLKKRIVK